MANLQAKKKREKKKTINITQAVMWVKKMISIKNVYMLTYIMENEKCQNESHQIFSISKIIS